MHPALLLVLLAYPTQAAGPSCIAVPCSVRIRSFKTADYDPASEFTLSGTVVDCQNGVLRLRLSVGVVRVHLGTAFPRDLMAKGLAVEILASRGQDEQRQWFVAREVRFAGKVMTLRTAQGLPI